MERIRMIGLGKSFGVRQVFTNVSFEIKEGERLGLVGPNGAGKSTLLKCILGLEELAEGQVVKSPVASIGYLQQDVNISNYHSLFNIHKATHITATSSSVQLTISIKHISIGCTSGNLC